MLFNLQGGALLLHFHTYLDIQVFSLCCSCLVIFSVLVEFRLIRVLHVVARMLCIRFFVHTAFHEIHVKFIHEVVFSLKVNHRSGFTFLIYKEERRYFGVFSHLGVVGTECRGDMNDTCTVVGGDIVSGYHPESLAFHFHELVLAVFSVKHLLRMLFGIFLYIVSRETVEFHARFHPWHKLLIAHANEFLTLVSGHYLIRHHLVAMLVILQWQLGTFRLEICRKPVLSHDNHYLLVGIRVIGLNHAIGVSRTHTEGSVRRQSPWRCGPCGKVSLAPLSPLCLRLGHLKQGSCRSVLHVTIATWLVKLMRRETGAGARGIRLNGISLVQQSLVVKLL